MRRTEAFWQTLLAAQLLYPAYMASSGACGIIPVPCGLHRAILLGGNSAGLHFVIGYRGHRRVPSLARHGIRTLQSRTKCQDSSQDNATSGASPGLDTDGKEPSSRRRASSSYVSSDYRGVIGGPKGKWKARIVSKGGVRHLGTFGCEVDAARAYNQAARALHGSSAKLNSLPEDVDVVVSSNNMSASLQGSATKNLVSTSELMDEGGSVHHTDPPKDFTFRDLEEIPVSSGRGLWPDEAAASSVYPSILGPDEEPEFVDSSKIRGLEANVGSTVSPEGINSPFSADVTDGVGRDLSVSTVGGESSGVAQSPFLCPIPSVATGSGSHGSSYDAEVGFLEGEGKQGDMLTSGEGAVDTEAWTLNTYAGLTRWEKESPGDDAFLDKLKLLVNVSTGLHPYWMDPLSRLSKPEVRKVAMHLSSANKLGYVSTRGGPVSKGSLLGFVLAQKEKHPTKVLLVRVGEFYETYGVDAVMMMQHAGLNKMGQEIRAGCPRKNVQQTLDGLTAAGLTVAVYEEMSDVDTQRGPGTKIRIKERALTQVVSPGSPNYLYEGCLRTDDISFRESRPYVGVMKDSSGYMLCQVFADEREIQVSERLTEEALRVSMEEAGFAEPAFCQDARLPFLPAHTEQLNGFSSAAFPGQVLTRVTKLLELTKEDLEHFQTVTRTFENRPRAVYPSTALQIGLLKNDNVPDLIPCLLPAGYPAVCHRFFRKWLLLPPSYRLADCTHELCKLLASSSQEGLPYLHAVPVGKAKALLLDRQCNVPFFREIHQCLRGMLEMLGEPRSLPRLSSERVMVGEDLGNISSDGGKLQREHDVGEGTSSREREDIVNAQLQPREESTWEGFRGKYSKLVPYLLELVTYQSGVEAVEDRLRVRAAIVVGEIERVVAPNTGADEITTDPHGLIPDTFWRNNEASFRGSLSLAYEPTRRAYEALGTAASELYEAVKEEFPNAAQDITFDLHNNAVFLTKLPGKEYGSVRLSPGKRRARERGVRDQGVRQEEEEEGDIEEEEGEGEEEEAAAAAADYGTKFIHPHDRNGKLLNRRFTTQRVSAALTAYLSAVQDTERTIKLELQGLSDLIVRNNDLLVIAQAAHWSVICQSLEGHTRKSLISEWALPSLKAFGGADMSMKVENLVPYWLPRGEAVSNSFDFKGLFLLTAPNMSGKSTLMRAVLACALLANAGLFVPCSAAVVPRYDGFFLRTASYDIPAEDKSAFALEMDDVRVMLRDSSARSLALVDELGKGTSSRDGAALAGALLEEMDRRSISGIFATHLHELFELPLQTSTLSYKRMAMDSTEADDPQWTYKMEDGKCTNSLALQTARKYNVPDSIINRAETLCLAFDKICRGRETAQASDGSMTGQEEFLAKATVALHRGTKTRHDGKGGDHRNEGWQRLRTWTTGWWPNSGRGWDGDLFGGSKKMEEAARVMRTVTGCTEDDIIWVNSGYGTPPALETRSCLYILRFSKVCPWQGARRVSYARSWGWSPLHDHDDRRRRYSSSPDAVLHLNDAAYNGNHGQRTLPTGEDSSGAHVLDAKENNKTSREDIDDAFCRREQSETGVWFYVGETDAIRERLQHHTKKWRTPASCGSSNAGIVWPASQHVGQVDGDRLDAIVLPVGNKSDARRLETYLIRAMKEGGFYLLSDRDGSRVNLPLTRKGV